ncbi:MAG: efflux RND transporter periplasmic adaptor subunit [Candidatus Sumerlaeota bacterium]
MKRIAFAEGDEITSGALVAELINTDAQTSFIKATLAQRQAEQQLATALNGGIESAQQELNAEATKLGSQADQLAKDADRAESLRAKGMASAKDASDARISARSAADDALLAKNKALRFQKIERQNQLSLLRQAVAAANADVSSASTYLDNMGLLAPEKGRLGKLMVSPGTFVEAGTTIADFSPDSAPVLEFWLSQSDANVVATDAKVAGSGEFENLKGVVRSVSTTVDPATGLVRIIAGLDNDSLNIRVGSTIPIAVETRNSAQGFIIPASAVSFNDDESVVAIVDGDRAKIASVEIVARSATEICVKGDDLSPDAKVISDGNMNLPDGAGVIVVKKTDE